MTASVPVVNVEKDGEVKVNGVTLRARADGWGVVGLEKAALLPLPRSRETGIYRAWIEKGLGIWASTVPAGPSNTQMMYRVRLCTMGMQEVPDLVFRGVVELRGQRLDFTQPKLHGREAVKRALLRRDEEVQWSVDERMLRFVEGGMVVGVDFSPEGDALQEVSISHFEKLEKLRPKPLTAEAKATNAVRTSVVSVEKDGTMKLNGVVLEPKPATRPKWLEKAVVLETLTNSDGAKVEMWGHRDSGIMLTTRTLGPATVPELAAVGIYADGSPDDSTLIFRGVLELRGQRLDFSQPVQTRRADLDKLRRPDETDWKWSETGTILQFREGATGLLLRLSSRDGGVNEAMIFPKHDGD